MERATQKIRTHTHRAALSCMRARAQHRQIEMPSAAAAAATDAPRAITIIVIAVIAAVLF